MGIYTFFLSAIMAFSLLFAVSHVSASDTHFVKELSFRQPFVTLEDGSGWEIAGSGGNVLFSWCSQDGIPIVITPNNLSGRFQYYLTNPVTGTFVSANLVKAPFRGSPFALILYKVDFSLYGDFIVYLSNGTAWKVPFQEKNELERWLLDDLIIIGKNNTWFSFNTHILINIHTNRFVHAQRF